MSDDPHSPGPPPRQRAGGESWFDPREPAASPAAQPSVYPVSPPERAWPSVRPPHPPAYWDPAPAAGSPYDPYRSPAPQPRSPFDWRDPPLDTGPPAYPYPAQSSPYPAQSSSARPSPGSVPAHATGAPERDGSVGWAWVLLAAAVLFLASAAWFAYQRTGQPSADPGAAVDRSAPTAPSTPARPSCAEVFVPGRTIDEEAALAPCRGPDGRLKAVGNFVCQDGRHLFQVDANTGAPGGWGFGGSAYRETADAATDRAYAAAYRECTT